MSTSRKRTPAGITQQKEANRLNLARYRAENGAIVDWLKDEPCMDCGEEYPPWVMDYHHRDPAEKEFSIGIAVSFVAARWWRLVLEIAKCDLLCANCHRIREGGGRCQRP